MMKRYKPTIKITEIKPGQPPAHIWKGASPIVQVGFFVPPNSPRESPATEEKNSPIAPQPGGNK